MYEWSWGIFAKKSKLHDAGGPDTMVSPKYYLEPQPDHCIAKGTVYKVCDIDVPVQWQAQG